MPSKTRTTAATTGSSRTLRSVPDQTVATNVRTDTEDKLWKALHANPNSTAADLSLLAQIGKSTAPKILAKWASDGAATRTPGIAEGGRRAADLWAITDVDTVPALADTAATKDYDAADTTQAEPDASARQIATLDHPDADSVTVTQEVSVDLTSTAADEAQDPVNSVAIDAVEAKPVAAEVSVPEVADGEGDTTTERGAELTSQKTTRLAAGALRGLIEDYLRDHPGEEFGPAAIAKALDGKSSGAVSNALDKLVANGTAVQTNDKPKRFALARAEQTAIPVPTS